MTLAILFLAASMQTQPPSTPAELAHAEMLLRELTAQSPDDLTLLFRLSRVQEEQQKLDEAEATLLYARQTQPAEVATYEMLTQFYARRVAAAPKPAPESPPAADKPQTLTAVEPDKDGFYRSPPSPAPRRLDIPKFPREAQDAGIDGLITAEVSLDRTGAVVGVRVLRSVPLLDEAAVDAVKHWHYEPVVVNGEPVPAKLTVTVNFSLRK